MERRMNLLNFHGNTREWLHPWRNLPKNHPETLGRGRPCQGEAADGHSQGTAQLLHLQHCILQEEQEEPSRTDGLKAEKGALAMEPALGKESEKLETTQDTKELRRGTGSSGQEKGVPCCSKPQLGGKRFKRHERRRSHRVPPGKAQPQAQGCSVKEGHWGPSPVSHAHGGVNSPPEDSVLPGIWVLKNCFACPGRKLNTSCLE